MTTTARPVCGEHAYLPLQLVSSALGLAPRPGTAELTDVQRHLRCTLETHTTSSHFDFVMELDGIDTGSVWTHWTRGHSPATVLVLPDCAATEHSTEEPCCEFADHPGAHSFELDDDWHGGAA